MNNQLVKKIIQSSHKNLINYNILFYLWNEYINLEKH